MISAKEARRNYDSYFDGIRDSKECKELLEDIEREIKNASSSGRSTVSIHTVGTPLPMINLAAQTLMHSGYLVDLKYERDAQNPAKTKFTLSISWGVPAWDADYPSDALEDDLMSFGKLVGEDMYQKILGED